jgi:predicted dehydrogenase
MPAASRAGPSRSATWIAPRSRAPATSIYPARYGRWDDAIRLAEPRELGGEAFDVVIIGTPPDLHVPLALAELGRTRRS